MASLARCMYVSVILMVRADVFIQLLSSLKCVVTIITAPPPCLQDYKFSLLPSAIYLLLTLIANFVSLCMVFSFIVGPCVLIIVCWGSHCYNQVQLVLIF